MSELPLPVQFLAAWIGTWLARRQDRLIGYLIEENRVLLERMGGKVRLTDPERRRLARIGKVVGRKALGEVASIATPDTILRWYRELVAKKYDGSSKRGPGRPGTACGAQKLHRRLKRHAVLPTVGLAPTERSRSDGADRRGSGWQRLGFLLAAEEGAGVGRRQVVFGENRWASATSRPTSSGFLSGRSRWYEGDECGDTR